jgi:hypothetical protein
MTQPSRRDPAPADPPRQPPVEPDDVDYGHGAVEGEPGGAQPGPSHPPADPPETPHPADAPVPVPSKR